MKTIAARVDDAQALLLDSIAEHRGVKTSELVRRALTHWLRSEAASDPWVASTASEMALERLGEVVKTFGIEPDMVRLAQPNAKRRTPHS
jgi:predicted transcriptional regulator